MYIVYVYIYIVHVGSIFRKEHRLTGSHCMTAELLVTFEILTLLGTPREPPAHSKKGFHNTHVQCICTCVCTMYMYMCMYILKQTNSTLHTQTLVKDSQRHTPNQMQPFKKKLLFLVGREPMTFNVLG